MKIPDDVRESVRQRIQQEADQLNWGTLSAIEKTSRYHIWARQSDIGGILIGYMNANEVHPYIKDALIKPYVRRKMGDPAMALSLLRLEEAKPKRRFEKPPGVLLDDNRIIAWHDAKHWKTTVFAVYERARQIEGSTPFGVVLFEAEGRFAEKSFREMAKDAATRLGIEKLVWHPS
jgi:hypothetical protein